MHFYILVKRKCGVSPRQDKFDEETTADKLKRNVKNMLLLTGLRDCPLDSSAPPHPAF